MAARGLVKFDRRQRTQQPSNPRAAQRDPGDSHFPGKYPGEWAESCGAREYQDSVPTTVRHRDSILREHPEPRLILAVRAWTCPGCQESVLAVRGLLEAAFPAVDYQAVACRVLTFPMAAAVYRVLVLVVCRTDQVSTNAEIAAHQPKLCNRPSNR